MDDLSEEDKLTVARARKVEKFLSQPFFMSEVFSGRKGMFVDLQESIDGFGELLEGAGDPYPEGAFYMQGGLKTATDEGRRMNAENADK